MSTITITRNDEGKIVGAGEKDQTAYAQFRKAIEALEPGEIATVAFWFPRNPALMGWHWIVLSAVFDHQEQFESKKVFQEWVAIGAGHADYFPGPKGRMIAVAKSINFDEIDDADFAVHHEACMDFLRSTACTAFLWPHLSDAQQAEMMSTILTECEVKREEIRARRQAGQA